MVRKIKKALSNPIFSGSLVMVIGYNFYNVCQFAFHFLAGRFLGKAAYGDLAVIISILGIFGVLQLALTLTIVKFISTEENSKRLKDFINWSFRLSFKAGLLIGLILLIGSPITIRFLNLSEPNSIFLFSPLIAIFVVTLTQRAVLQGLLKFGKLVISLIIEALAKLIFLILFIGLSYAVFGAVFSIFISIVLSSTYMLIILKKYLKGKIELKPDISKLLKYTYFVLIQGLALTTMYSLDLILVKHFFSPEDAGMYAALAILGRVVFFGASPVTQVMFPLVSKRHGRGEKYEIILYISLILIIIYSALVTMLYYFYPTLPLGILYGESFLGGAKLLWWYGLFMSMLAIAMLLTQFYLSINKTWVSFLFAAIAITQVSLIWFIHYDLLTVIKISLSLSTLLVIILLLYFPYHKGF